MGATDRLIEWARPKLDRLVGGFNRRPPKPGHPAWNHNIAYHHVAVDAAPHPCRRALDVGCGEGRLVEELAGVADQVVGLEPDAAAAMTAANRLDHLGNVTLVRGDVLTADLPSAGFDLVTAVAVLHHLPLDLGLARLADLVAPGGTLVVIGLRREHGFVDLALGALAFPVANALALARGHTAVNAPIHDPTETFAEIREAARRITPGAHIRRRLLFRYTLVWTRPRVGTDRASR
jgi:SAM-dependent methyltransferase